MKEQTATVRAALRALEEQPGDLTHEERVYLGKLRAIWGGIPSEVTDWKVHRRDLRQAFEICARLGLELEPHWRVVRETHPASPAMDLALQADRARMILEAHQPGSTPRFSPEPYISQKAWDTVWNLRETGSDTVGEWMEMVLSAPPTVGHLLVSPSLTHAAELLAAGLVKQDPTGTYFVPRSLATYVLPAPEGWILLKRG